MKNILFLIIILSVNLSKSQQILKGETTIKSPENYIFKEINFSVSKKNIKMCGTLITPKSEYSTIVIVAAGAGRDTRYSHYLLTEQLLKNGIAVYRYDDRGTGESEGKFRFNAYHNIEDLRNAFNKIKSIDFLDKKSIGILGHSAGAYAASIVNYDKTTNVDFLILIGCPIEWKGEWRSHKFKKTKEKISEELIYKKLTTPTLFIGGENDTTSDMTSASKLLKKLNNKNIDVKILSKLDHYLKIGNDDWKQTKDLSTIYEMTPDALELIINWVKNTSSTKIPK